MGGTPLGGAFKSYTVSSDVAYADHGAIQTLYRGDGLTESWSFNNRLQPATIAAGSAFGVNLSYCANGASSCNTNNGNVRSITQSAPTPTVGCIQQSWSADDAPPDSSFALTSFARRGHQ